MKRAVWVLGLVGFLLLGSVGPTSAWHYRGGFGFRYRYFGHHDSFSFSYHVPLYYPYRPPVYYYPAPPPVLYYSVPPPGYSYPTGRWEWRCDPGGFCQWMWQPAY